MLEGTMIFHCALDFQNRDDVTEWLSQNISFTVN